MAWTPINNIDFDGILQGNGHIISNFTIQNQSNFMIHESIQACGFFGFLFETAEIHNLTLDNVTIKYLISLGDQDDNIALPSCGVLCGFGREINISNCNITNCKIDITYSNNSSSTRLIFIGGLFGIAFVNETECIITNCNVINCRSSIQ